MEQPWLLAILVCPVVMGGTMIWMMREMRGMRAERAAREPTREEAVE